MVIPFISSTHSFHCLLIFIVLLVSRRVECSFPTMPLDFLWTPTAPNGSNVTEFTCQCFTYMDASTGRCLPSSITSRAESMAAEIKESPLLNKCQYKRVILGQRVVIRCPYARNDSYWSSIGRWNNSTDVCIDTPPEEYGFFGSRACGRSDHIILTHRNELIIDPILPTDPGIYECVKLNKTSYLDVEIFRLGIVIDYETALYGQLVYSSIVGTIAAAAFLAIALSAHFLRVLVEYCRNQEMNKHVQWVIEFVSRSHTIQHGPLGLRPLFRYPPNGSVITEKIIEETPMSEDGTIFEVMPDVEVVDPKASSNGHIPNRGWVPYMGVRMEQLTSIRERASQQMDKVRARYYERAQRVRTQCGSQMDQLHQQYHTKLSKMKNYSSSRYYNIRVKYYKKRQDLNNYANMKMTLIRNNYTLQRQYLAKVMDSLAIDSCRSYAPSFMGGSEDYQASLRGGDSIAGGLDLDPISMIEDGTTSLASSKRIPVPPVDEDDDASVNIDLDWECMTPPEPPPVGAKRTAEGEEPISAPDSPVIATKSGKLTGCLIPCHSTITVHQQNHQIPPQLLRCPAFQMGICSDGRHNHVHGPKNKPVTMRKETSSSKSPRSQDSRAKSAVIDSSEVKDPLLGAGDKCPSEPALTLRAIEESLPFVDE